MNILRAIVGLLTGVFVLLSQAAAQPSLISQKGSLFEQAALSPSAGVQYVHLRGYNGAMTTTYEMAWPESAVYTVGTSALSTPYCASANANDTAAGTGARTIRVSGATIAGSTLTAFTETVTMNGQSSVNLATANVLVIHSIEVLTAGSGLGSAGIIQCGTGTNSSGDPQFPHAYLAAYSETSNSANVNKSEMFLYAVPDNYKLICSNIKLGSSFATAASSGAYALDAYLTGGIPKRLTQGFIHNTGSNPGGQSEFVVVPENTVLMGKVAGPTGSNTGPVTLSADCLLVADSAR